MSDWENFDPVTGMLALTTDAMEIAFEIATRQALEDHCTVFLFDGHTIELGVALDVLHDMKALRTYH